MDIKPPPSDFYKNTPLPLNPTKALPGTESKIKVLIERYERRETLWHPKDAINTPLIEKMVLKEYSMLLEIEEDMDTDDRMRLARNNISNRLVLE